VGGAPPFVIDDDGGDVGEGSYGGGNPLRTASNPPPVGGAARGTFVPGCGGCGGGGGGDAIAASSAMLTRLNATTVDETEWRFVIRLRLMEKDGTEIVGNLSGLSV